MIHLNRQCKILRCNRCELDRVRYGVIQGVNDLLTTFLLFTLREEYYPCSKKLNKFYYRLVSLDILNSSLTYYIVP